MPVCQKCGSQWAWSESIKKSFQFYNGAKCQYCGEKQFQTQKTMRKVSLITMIPLLMLPFVVGFEVPIGIALIIFVAAEFLCLLLFPLVLQLSNEEHPLW
ncbi:TIGR04104 family putative zinc finger protein [Halobacillus campisalis]|uniref:TIGR04104 family putative zinc finger protein n=1 Tax=Halobacillus campisalis TaxID=435909 RepID=A0ABW2K002_9BACI|nr:TIGR04104 family putative zinc finger protein [Halobacillus campisalis]